MTVLPEGVTTNFQDLAKRTKRYDVGDQFKPSTVFLTTSAFMEYGLGSNQPVIAFNEWKPEYRSLDIFKSPVKFYVIVVGEQGEAINRRWLDSIAADNWLRARCLVHRIAGGNPLTVFQWRMGNQQQYPPSAYGGKTADEVFERSLKFTELPQHNHVQMLDGLAKNTKPADLPRDISGGFPMAISPNIDRAEVWGYPQPDVSETAGGLATGGSGNGSNYGK